MKKRLLILALLVITMSSCTGKILGQKYVAFIKKAQNGIESSYSVKGLFDHFPKSISNQSYIFMEASIPTKIFDPESSWFAYSYLFLDMGEDSQVYYPDKFLYKAHYANRNFIIDCAFTNYKQMDTLKLRNVSIPGTYPIPYFSDFDFGLGSVIYNIHTSGISLPIDCYNVPDDLEVFVLKSGSGFFWKIKFEQERPESLGDWKNGYSSGIAISKSRNIVVYWMMAW